MQGEYDLLGWLAPTEPHDVPVLTQRKEAIVEGGMVTQVDFGFAEEGAFLEGIITYKEEPVRSAQLHLQVWDSSGSKVYSLGAAVFHRGNRYGFERVPKGKARLKVWAPVWVDGNSTELGDTLEFDIQENAKIFKSIELYETSDSLVVDLSSLTESQSGSLILLRGEVQITNVTEESWEALTPLVVTGRNIKGSSSAHFGYIEPGRYTIVLLTQDAEAAERAEDDPDSVLLVREVIDVVEGKTTEISLPLPE